MRLHRSARGEEGVTLILAMAFLMLFSLVIAATLALAGTDLKTTSVVNARSQKLYASDGGIDYGIQKLRSDDSICPDTKSVDATVGDVTLNGRTVHVTCTTLSGDDGAGGTVFGQSGWTTVATGLGTAAWSSTKARCGSASTPTDLGSTIQIINCNGATGPVRTITDGVITKKPANTLTSATAAFTAADKGATLTGANIPAGTTIMMVTNATTVKMSGQFNTTLSGQTVVIGGKPAVTFGGTRVFNAGGINIPSTVTGTIQGSIVEYDDHGYCTRDKANVNVVVGGTWTCAQPGATAIPDPKPHVVVPPDAAVHSVTATWAKNTKNLTAVAGTTFSSNDAGSPVTGTNIAANTTIASVTDATHAVLSANAPQASLPTGNVLTITTPGAHAKVTQACGGQNINYLYPGQYVGTAPGWGGYTYFASGVYYIANTGETAISGTELVGGEPGPNDAAFVPQGGLANCFTDAAANAACGGCLPTDPGKGVTFILGGTTLLDIHSGTTELFTRIPGTMDAAATPGTTIFAMPAGGDLSLLSGGTYAPSNTAGADRCNCAFVTDNSGQQIIFHGLTYSPYAPVDVYNNAGVAYSPFYGGLVANWIVARVDAGSQAGLFTGQFGATLGPTMRTIVIRATAPGTSGDGTSTSTAVVTIDVDSGKTTAIKSWRNE